MTLHLPGKVSPRMQVLTAVALIPPLLIAMTLAVIYAEYGSIPRPVVGLVGLLIFLYLVIGTAVSRKDIDKNGE